MSDAFLEAHRIDAGLFTIAGYLHPISVRDQILRAYEFVRRARSTGLLRPGSHKNESDPKFLVVGAGVAGVSAALWASSAGIPTILIDKKDAPFARLSNCDTRFLDPTQYDWPLSHWTVGAFQWHHQLADSILPWHQVDTPQSLASIWDAILKYRRIQQSEHLQFLPEHELFNITRNSNSIFAHVEDLSNNAKYDILASVALITIGFGKEVCHLGNKYHQYDPNRHPFNGPEFWSSDMLDEDDFGIEKDQPRILISGNGDGALQDYLRIVTKPEYLTPKSMLIELNIAPEIQKTVQDLHDCSERKIQWLGDLQYDHRIQVFVEERYREFVDGILDQPANPVLNKIQQILRDPLPQLRMIWTCNHFSRSYPLNRFLVTLFSRYIEKFLGIETLWRNRRVVDVQEIKYDNGVVEYEYKYDDCVSCYNAVPLGNVQKEVADIILLRHGISFEDIPDELQPLLHPPRTRQLLPYGFVG